MTDDRQAVVRQVADGGTLTYIEHFYSPAEADALFSALLQNIDWKQEQGRFGRLYPRLTALYADEGTVYTYSGVTYPSLPWTAELAGIRRRVEEAGGAPFNSVLLNLYRDGGDSMGFHSDDEPELGKDPIVPS